MSTALLETKLHPPPRRRSLIARPRLQALLSRSATSPVTLVSAPPGFGKSTLVAEWFGGPARSWTCAWLSLDAADSDPATFWPYLLASLDRVVPQVAATAREHVSQGSFETGLTELLNALSAVGSEVVLVLDDYHTVDGPAVDVRTARAS